LLAKEPRMLGVLNLAAEKANWGKPLPISVGARHWPLIFRFETYVAQVIEASVKKMATSKFIAWSVL